MTLVDELLSPLSMIQSPLAFVSVPVTGGKLKYALLERGLPADRIIEQNDENVRSRVARIDAMTALPVLYPGALSVSGWTQEQFHEFYEKLIARHVEEMWFLDDWEFQPGSIRELVVAYEIQFGIRTHRQLEIFREDGAPLLLHSAAELLTCARENLQSRGFQAGAQIHGLAKLARVCAWADEYSAAPTHYQYMGSPVNFPEAKRHLLIGCAEVHGYGSH